VHNGHADRAFVVAQLGQSLDGRIATLSGHSRFINRDAALDHLHALRAAVDVVLVGVGTVVADDPRLTVRRCPGRHPARAVLDPHGRVPAMAKVFADDGVRRLLLIGEAVPVPAELPQGVEVLRLATGPQGVAPQTITAGLTGAGFRRILVEGGAHTISRFLAAGALDRLHVLVAPILLGSGIAALALPPITTVQEALKPTTRAVLLDGGEVLFDCDLTRPDLVDARDVEAPAHLVSA
jgi:riboflavin-specific deaminase-like protein